eukprot:6179461-Pleurochrysis_carterae.AAC.8
MLAEAKFSDPPWNCLRRTPPLTPLAFACKRGGMRNLHEAADGRIPVGWGCKPAMRSRQEGACRSGKR